MTHADIGLRVWHYLGDHGIRQVWVADQLGMGHATFAQRLLGRTAFTLAEYTQLCNLLRVPGVRFLTDDPTATGPIGLTDEDVRQRIKRHMRRRNMSQWLLAVRLDMSSEALRNRLQGRTPLRMGRYLAICAVLDVPPAYFFQYERGCDFP